MKPTDRIQRLHLCIAKPAVSTPGLPRVAEFSTARLKPCVKILAK